VCPQTQLFFRPYLEEEHYGPRAPLCIEEGSKGGDRGTAPFPLGIRGREWQGDRKKVKPSPPPTFRSTYHASVSGIS